MKIRKRLAPMIFLCLCTLLIAGSAYAGVDPGARDSVWFMPDVFVWNGDTAFVTGVYADNDEALEHATIILDWSSNQVGIDSVSVAGSRWASYVDGDSGVFVASQGYVGGVLSDDHYNLSFLPFGSLLSTGSGLICTIYWSKTVPTVSASTITIDSSTTSSASQVQNSTLFGVSGLPDDNFVPGFSGVSMSVVTCDCPYQSDFNEDGFADSVDLGFLIDIVYFGGTDAQDPNCPYTRGDFNMDGFSDSVDLAYLIDYVFFGGVAPVSPCP